MPTSLFDADERSDETPRRQTEPVWAYLNRSARWTHHFQRKRIENWFEDYAPDPTVREAFTRRFRSMDSRQHLLAYLELYTYTLLTRLSYEVEIVEVSPPSAPVFRVQHESGQSFMLMLVSLLPDAAFEASNHPANALIDLLNTGLKSPHFMLALDLKSVPPDMPPDPAVVGSIQRWIDQLDFKTAFQHTIQDELQRRKTGTPPRYSRDLRWSSTGAWKFDLYAVPNILRQETDVIAEVTVSQPRAGRSKQNLSQILIEASDDAGSLDMPLVLALNDFDDTLTPRHIQAAFGDGGGLAGRLTGLLGRNRPQPPTAAVSAIWHFPGLSSLETSEPDAILYHHPHALNPLPPEVFRFRQAIPDAAQESISTQGVMYAEPGWFDEY